MKKSCKRGPADIVMNAVIAVLLALFAVFCLYPILYVLFASFSDPTLLNQHTGLLLHPLDFTVQGYKVAASYSGVWTGYLNTIFVVVVGTTVNIVMTVLGAYVLSRRDLYIHRIANLLVVFTMFFNGGLVPTYLTVKALGLLDSRWALILPVAISTWNLIILRTSIDSLPPSLLESARIDGANDMVILFRIVVPLVKATIAVLVLYYAVGHWNSWVNAMLYIKDRDKYPLQLILREILIENTSNAATQAIGNLSEIDQYKQLVKYCTTMIATLPILCIYPFLQKYFVKGVMVGAVKG